MACFQPWTMPSYSEECRPEDREQPAGPAGWGATSAIRWIELSKCDHGHRFIMLLLRFCAIDRIQFELLAN
jgi:hypothetical protein